MSEYNHIKNYYKLEFKSGTRVRHEVTKKFGEVKPEGTNEIPSHYVAVQFDGSNFSVPCHPQELELLK